MALTAAGRADHQNLHTLRREIENLGELLVDLAVHLDGGAVGDLHHDLSYFRLDLAEGLKRHLAHHFRRDRPAHINPIAFLAGLAVLPLGRVGVKLASSHIAAVAQWSRSSFPGLRNALHLWL